MINTNQRLKIGIVNYGLSNLGSLYSAFHFYNYNANFIDRPDELDKFDVIILGGVGNFAMAATRLRELSFWDALGEAVLVKKKPVLGICLGMQLFADVSYEGKENKGLGWIKGKVIRLSGDSVRVPHMGWNKVEPEATTLFKGMLYGSFYFMHSYHFVPEDRQVVAATTRYGGLEMVSAVQKNNIIGVQFHPEKSQGDGLRFLRNFLEVGL